MNIAKLNNSVSASYFSCWDNKSVLLCQISNTTLIEVLTFFNLFLYSIYILFITITILFIIVTSETCTTFDVFFKS